MKMVMVLCKRVLPTAAGFIVAACLLPFLALAFCVMTVYGWFDAEEAYGHG